MTHDVEERRNVSLVRLRGELNGRDAGAFVKTVNDLMDRRELPVVLLMDDVPYVNSDGLADLVRLTARANSQGGRLILAGPSPFVAGVLKATRLDRFFEVCADVDEALVRVSR